MTRAWHRRLTRLRNYRELILVAVVVTGSSLYAVDRLASLGARMARALL